MEKRLINYIHIEMMEGFSEICQNFELCDLASFA